MAVYTEVSLDEAAALVTRLGLGRLNALQGIRSGIENTNYFADTDQGRYVLTVFERLGFEREGLCTQRLGVVLELLLLQEVADDEPQERERRERAFEKVAEVAGGEMDEPAPAERELDVDDRE